jgi:hypothetical protein
MTSDPGQAPRAQGDLARNPFAHLVLYAYREQLDGTLIVEHRGYEVRVLFRQGRAVAAHGLPRGAALQEGMLELCGAPSGAFAFWDADRVGSSASVVRGTVDPYTFVAESLRMHARKEVIAQVVDRYLGVPLRVAADCDPVKYGLRGADARFIERLRSAPQTPEQLSSGLEPGSERARQLLYLLLVTKVCGPEGGEMSSTSGIRTAVSVSPQRSSQPSMPAVSIEPGSQRPPPSAAPTPSPPPPSSGRPTSFTPSRGIPASMPAWQQIAAWRAASQAPPATKTPVPPAVRAPTPSMAPPPVELLDDSGKLRRAEQLIERRAFVDASRILAELGKKNPKDAQVASLQAWTLYQQWSSERPSQELIDSIERALKVEPEHVRALYVKALVLRKMGRENDALRMFQRVLHADPAHIDAMRELRLAKMRRGKEK